MAGTATIVETVTDKLDDNLLIPAFSGFNGQLVVFILGIGKMNLSRKTLLYITLE